MLDSKSIVQFLLNLVEWRINYLRFPQGCPTLENESKSMKNYTKILFSILVATMCTVSFAAEKPAGCKKSGKNCPMNDNKECTCGKACDCKAPSKPK
jgi:hypothetical protein